MYVRIIFHILPTSYPKTAEIIEKRLPPPTPQERMESDQDGHPARVKPRRGGRRELNSLIFVACLFNSPCIEKLSVYEIVSGAEGVKLRSLSSSRWTFTSSAFSK